MIFDTYKKYILNTYLKILIEVTLIFFSLILIINLFEEITFLKDMNANNLYPVFLSFLNAPSIIVDVLPFIFLISTQLFFIKISNKNELFVFKYSGLTNVKILANLVLFSFFLGIVLVLGFYNLSSVLKSHYLELKNNFTTDNKYLAVITENGFWIKDEVDEIISITNAVKINENFLMDVSIVQFDTKYNLLQSIDSEKINIQNKTWVLKNATISKDNTRQEVALMKLNSNFDLEKINSLFLD